MRRGADFVLIGRGAICIMTSHAESFRSPTLAAHPCPSAAIISHARGSERILSTTWPAGKVSLQT